MTILVSGWLTPISFLKRGETLYKVCKRTFFFSTSPIHSKKRSMIRISKQGTALLTYSGSVSWTRSRKSYSQIYRSDSSLKNYNIHQEEYCSKKNYLFLRKSMIQHLLTIFIVVLLAVLQTHDKDITEILETRESVTSIGHTVSSSLNLIKDSDKTFYKDCLVKGRYQYFRTSNRWGKGHGRTFSWIGQPYNFHTFHSNINQYSYPSVVTSVGNVPYYLCFRNLRI